MKLSVCLSLCIVLQSKRMNPDQIKFNMWAYLDHMSEFFSTFLITQSLGVVAVRKKTTQKYNDNILLKTQIKRIGRPSS